MVQCRWTIVLCQLHMCIQILSMLAADKLNILIKGHCNNLITAGIKLAAIKKVK